MMVVELTVCPTVGIQESLRSPVLMTCSQSAKNYQTKALNARQKMRINSAITGFLIVIWWTLTSRRHHILTLLPSPAKGSSEVDRLQSGGVNISVCNTPSARKTNPVVASGLLQSYSRALKAALFFYDIDNSPGGSQKSWSIHPSIYTSTSVKCLNFKTKNNKQTRMYIVAQDGLARKHTTLGI